MRIATTNVCRHNSEYQLLKKQFSRIKKKIFFLKEKEKKESYELKIGRLGTFSFPFFFSFSFFHQLLPFVFTFPTATHYPPTFFISFNILNRSIKSPINEPPFKKKIPPPKQALKDFRLVPSTPTSGHRYQNKDKGDKKTFWNIKSNCFQEINVQVKYWLCYFQINILQFIRKLI